ncbi:MAG: hypothetical protein AAGA93_23060 [Actinomycetota bacterium]
MTREKYAVGEYERRFLLDDIPAGATDPRRIVDRYIDDTRLRLRTVEQAGAETERKLGHKRRLSTSDPTAIMHTSLYLDDDEFRTLATLPARRLVKTRLAITVDGTPCSVNVFDESLTGLILMEVDLGDPSLLDGFVPPPWAGADVSGDEAFTGGGLAGKSLDDLAEALATARSRTAR